LLAYFHFSIQRNAKMSTRRDVMTELFTMIVLAANIIAALVFAKFAPTASPDAPAASEQSSDAGIFEGRLTARIRVRDARIAVSRDIGQSVSPYWGSRASKARD
jgi:hypothetical protein